MNFELNKSKTLWSFAIVLVLTIGKALLEQNDIVLPGTTWDAVIEITVYIAGFFGIYGLRDALRKIQLDMYYNEKTKPKD
jgi:ABC-type protease/lipase transport system fused ATPase/permease subunit